MSYSVGLNTKFLFRGCYHEYPGNALNAVDIDLTGSTISDNLVYITYPLYCPKCCDGVQNENKQILHWACGHAYTGDVDDPSIRKENFWDPVKDMRFSRIGLTVSHPRWCAACISERSFQIYKNHDFIYNGYRGPWQDDQMYHLAWNMGIRQGRIEALSIDTRPPPDHTPQPGLDPDDPLTEILSRLSSIAIDDMDRLAKLMSQTVLAPNPYTIPFNFPTLLPYVDAFPDVEPEEQEEQGEEDGEGGVKMDEPGPAAIFTINYYALWHPIGNPRYTDSTDRLASTWLGQIASRDVAELARIRHDLAAVYIDARNKGVIYQLSQEQEVLYEPEGDRRAAALASTTMAFHVLDLP